MPTLINREGHPLRWQAIGLALLFLVGLLGHAWAVTRPLMLAITPWFLLLTGAASLALAWPEQARDQVRLGVWFSVAFFTTFLIEVLGVSTGKVFGPYHYGEILGFALGGVPLVIGFNWVLVIMGAVSLFEGWPGSRWYAAPAAAILAVGFDWVMEPIAIHYGYWSWDHSEIPMQNYLAWFLIALVLACSWVWGGLRLRRRSLPILILMQALFFGAMRGLV